MAFTTRELERRKKTIQATLADAELRYKALLGTNSVAEKAVGTDVLSLRAQIKEIDTALASLDIEQDPNIPRREDFPTSPNDLVDGINPRNGIKTDARIVVRPDGTFYYVDSEGQVIPRL